MIVAAIISLNSIEETINQLNYRSDKSLKYKLLHAIRAFYTDEASVRTIEAIPPEPLIEALWVTGGDPHLVSKKRKNLNSVKSSVNSDLQKLFKAGNNPDGISISAHNIFVISDEAKDKALKSFIDKIPGDTPASLDDISKILNVVTDILSNPEGAETDNPADRLKKLSDIKDVVQNLSKEIDLQKADSDEHGLNRSDQADPKTASGNGVESHQTGHSPGNNPNKDNGISEKSRQNNDGDRDHNGSFIADGRDLLSETDSMGQSQTDDLSGMGDGYAHKDVMSLPVSDDDAEDPQITERDSSLEPIENVGEFETKIDSDTEEAGGSGGYIDGQNRDDGSKGPHVSSQISDGDAMGHGQKEGLSDTGEGSGDTDGMPPPLDDIDESEAIEIEDDLEELEFIDELDTEHIPDKDETGEPGGYIDGQNNDDDSKGSNGTSQASDADAMGQGQKEGLSGTGDGGANTEMMPPPLDDIDDSKLVEVEDDLEALEFVDDVEIQDPLESSVNTGNTNGDDRSNGVTTIAQPSDGDATGQGQKDGLSDTGEGSGDTEMMPPPLDDIDDSEAIEIEDDLEELEFIDELDTEGIPDREETDGFGANANNPEGDTGSQGSKETGQALDSDAMGQGQKNGLSGTGDDDITANNPPMSVDEMDDSEIIEDGDDLEEVELLEELETGETDTGNKAGTSGTQFQTHDDMNGNDADVDNASGAQETMDADNNLDAIEMGHDAEWRSNPQKARYLAESFNRSLAAMDKFYNQYIQIPQGTYVIGAKQAKKNEKPKQMVELASFYIGKFPVTNALFEVFVEKTGYQTTAEKWGYGTVYEGRCRKTVDPRMGQEKHIWHADIVNKTVEGAFWYQPSGPGDNIHKKRNHPVVQVSIHDALAFAAWTGKRLPSEEEWEAASRTANTFNFPWGNDWRSGACNIEESSVGDTVPVDQYLDYENEFGLADTMGNVLEWTFCPATSQSEPNKPVYNVAKGGSWISGNDLRLCSQFQLKPESHSNLLGFRSVAY
jgi:formylglycine-generating enzyme required for sulfatase activity